MLVQRVPWPGAAAAASPVTLSNKSVYDQVAGTAKASYTLGTDRIARDQDGNALQTWLAAGNNPADYSVRATLSSGSSPAGAPLGQWLNLSTARTWSLTQTGGAAGSATGKINVEIRATANPSVVLDSATITITADSLSSSSGVAWANIAPPRGTFTGSNADQTMTAGGTLNFSKGSFPGTYKVFKNGVDKGQVASLAVAAGDAVHFSATYSDVGSWTFTVSGAASDSFSIVFRDVIDTGGTL